MSSIIELIVVVLIFFLVLGIVFYILSESRFKNFPPGPINVPLIGYLPLVIGKNMEAVYMDLKKKYGDVVYFRLGTKDIVAFNSYETIKEALVLNHEVAVTRPEQFNILSYLLNDSGHVVDNGNIWLEQRRFLMRTLRDLGMGKSSLESEIKEEATVLMEEISNKCGKPFDLYPLFTNAAANIITALLHGFRFHYNDPKFHELLYMLVTSPRRISPLKLINFFPYVRHMLPGFITGMAEVHEAKSLIERFMDKQLTKPATLDEETSNYSNLYERRLSEELAKGHHNTTFTHARLRNNIANLNIAGTATTTNTMYWVLKMIIRRPDIQEKLHKEIDSVVGFDKTPSISDKHNMSYTDAFLMEVQRYGDILPIGVPHSTISGTKIAGYDIPKGATIMTMLCMVHNDPKIWGDPQNFRPERFLGEDGKAIKSEYLIPFSTGKRYCPGEQLAIMAIFIFTTFLLQRFEFSPASIAYAEIEDNIFGFTRDLPSFKVIIKPRN